MKTSTTLITLLLLSCMACTKPSHINRLTDSVKKYNKLAVKSDVLAQEFAANHKYPDMLQHFTKGEEYRKKAGMFQDSINIFRK